MYPKLALGALLLVACSAHAAGDVRSMPFSLSVSSDITELTGRWVTDEVLEAPLLGRTNAAEISCSKQEMMCVESLAVLITPEENSRMSSTFLMPLLGFYKVKTWTDSGIVAVSEKKVADVTLSIDLTGQKAARTYQEKRAGASGDAKPPRTVSWHLR